MNNDNADFWEIYSTALCSPCLLVRRKVSRELGYINGDHVNHALWN